MKPHQHPSGSEEPGTCGRPSLHVGDVVEAVVDIEPKTESDICLATYLTELLSLPVSAEAVSLSELD